LLIGFFSCCKTHELVEKCPPECSAKDSLNYPLEIVWESYFYKDTTWVLFSGKPVSYREYILFCGFDPVKEDKYHIYIFNKDSGKQIHRFNLYLNPAEDLKIYKNYLITTSFDGIYVFDLDKLTLVKHFDQTNELNTHLIGDFLYLIQDFGELPYLDSSSVIKMDLRTLEIEKILTLTKKEYGGYASFNSVSVDVVTGDTILYGLALTKSPLWIFAYNSNKKEYVWKTNIYGGDIYSRAPVIDEKYFYITQNHKAFAYDKFTGEKIWQTKIEGFYRPMKPLLLYGRLFLKAGNNHLYCIDANNGSIIWHNRDAGNAGFDTPAHFGSYLYYSDELYFRVIDIKTGKVLFKEKGPYQKVDLDNLEKSRREFAKFSGVIPFVDLEKRVFYLPDTKRLFCFKLPDTWYK